MDVKLSSLEELAGHLKSDRIALRVAVLQALNQQVAELCRTGKNLHPQLIDLLYEHYCKTPELVERNLCTCIILQSHETVKLTVAEQQFLNHDDQTILLMCADALGQLPKTQRVQLLTSVVMGKDRLIRQRLSANLLSDCLSLLATDVVLRVAILSDHQVPLPEPTSANLELWIEELSGPYRLNVRRILARQEPAGLHIFLENWDKLDGRDACWVLDRMLRGKVQPDKNILMDILDRGNDPRLLQKALGTLARDTLTSDEESVVESLYQHTDPDVGAAALMVGKAELPWDQWLAASVDNTLRLAVLQRIAWQRFTSSLPFLGGLLLDKNWKIRARATEALAALAPASLDILLAHARGEDTEAKIGAAQALRRLGYEQSLLHSLS